MLAKGSKGLSLLSQRKLLVDVVKLLKGEKGSSTAAPDRSANTDHALCDVAYLVSGHRRLMISTCNFGMDVQYRFELFQYVQKRGQLPKMVQSMLGCAVAVFKVTRRSWPTLRCC